MFNWTWIRVEANHVFDLKIICWCTSSLEYLYMFLIISIKLSHQSSVDSLFEISAEFVTMQYLQYLEISKTRVDFHKIYDY